MTEAPWVIAGIVLAGGAQAALKQAAAHGPALPWAVAAGLAYLGAFAVYFRLLRHLDLAWLSPVMVGGVTLLAALAGHLMGEPLGATRLAGIALVLAGLGLLAAGG